MPRAQSDSATIQKENREIVCYRCRQPGHTIRKCPQPKITRELKVLENDMTDEESKNLSP